MWNLYLHKTSGLGDSACFASLSAFSIPVLHQIFNNFHLHPPIPPSLFVFFFRFSSFIFFSFFFFFLVIFIFSLFSFFLPSTFYFFLASIRYFQTPQPFVSFHYNLSHHNLHSLHTYFIFNISLLLSHHLPSSFLIISSSLTFLFTISPILIIISQSPMLNVSIGNCV